MSRRNIQLLNAGIVFSLIIISIYRPLSDFAGYYFGSRLLLVGQFGSQVYDPAWFNQYIFDSGFKQVFVSYTPFPPLTALISLPLAVFPSPFYAKIVLNLLSGLLWLSMLWHFTKQQQPGKWFPLLATALFFMPLLNNFVFGQMYVILPALLYFGYVFYEKKKHVPAGLLWALAIGFKLLPGILLVYLALRREWRMLITTVLSLAVLLMISVVLQGWDIWKIYIFEIMPRLARGELHDPFATAFQNFFMLAKQALQFDPVFNPHPIVNSSVGFALAVSLFRLGVFAVLLSIAVRNESALTGIAACLLAALLISPAGSSYSLLLLLFVLLVLNNQQNRNYWLIGMLFIAVNIQPAWLNSFAWPFNFLRFWLLLAVVIIWTKIHWPGFDRQALAVSVLISLIPLSTIRTELDDRSQPLLKTKQPLLIYDYFKSSADSLNIEYWSESGQQHLQVYLPDAVMADAQIRTEGQTLKYKGQALSVSKGWLKKARLLGKRKIIFLSDAGRGVGFYAPRIIEIEGISP